MPSLINVSTVIVIFKSTYVLSVIKQILILILSTKVTILVKGIVNFAKLKFNFSLVLNVLPWLAIFLIKNKNYIRADNAKMILSD